MLWWRLEWWSPLVTTLVILIELNYGFAENYHASLERRQRAIDAVDLPCGSEVVVEIGEEFLFDSKSAIIFENSLYSTQYSDDYYESRRRRAAEETKMSNTNSNSRSKRNVKPMMNPSMTNRNPNVGPNQNTNPSMNPNMNVNRHQMDKSKTPINQAPMQQMQQPSKTRPMVAPQPPLSPMKSKPISRANRNQKQKAKPQTSQKQKAKPQTSQKQKAKVQKSQKKKPAAQGRAYGGDEDDEADTYGGGSTGGYNEGNSRLYNYGLSSHVGGSYGYVQPVKPLVCQWNFTAGDSCTLESHIIKFKPGDHNCYKQQFIISDTYNDFRLCGGQNLYPAFRAETPSMQIKYWRQPYTYRHVFKGYVTCVPRAHRPSFDTSYHTSSVGYTSPESENPESGSYYFQDRPTDTTGSYPEQAPEPNPELYPDQSPEPYSEPYPEATLEAPPYGEQDVSEGYANPSVPEDLYSKSEASYPGSQSVGSEYSENADQIYATPPSEPEVTYNNYEKGPSESIYEEMLNQNYEVSSSGSASYPTNQELYAESENQGSLSYPETSNPPQSYSAVNENDYPHTYSGNTDPDYVPQMHSASSYKGPGGSHLLYKGNPDTSTSQYHQGGSYSSGSLDSSYGQGDGSSGGSPSYSAYPGSEGPKYSGGSESSSHPSNYDSSGHSGYPAAHPSYHSEMPTQSSSYPQQPQNYHHSSPLMTRDMKADEEEPEDDINQVNGMDMEVMPEPVKVESEAVDEEAVKPEMDTVKETKDPENVQKDKDRSTLDITDREKVSTHVTSPYSTLRKYPSEVYQPQRTRVEMTDSYNNPSFPSFSAFSSYVSPPIYPAQIYPNYLETDYMPEPSYEPEIATGRAHDTSYDYSPQPAVHNTPLRMPPSEPTSIMTQPFGSFAPNSYPIPPPPPPMNPPPPVSQSYPPPNPYRGQPITMNPAQGYLQPDPYFYQPQPMQNPPPVFGNYPVGARPEGGVIPSTVPIYVEQGVVEYMGLPGTSPITGYSSVSPSYSVPQQIPPSYNPQRIGRAPGPRVYGYGP